MRPSSPPSLSNAARGNRHSRVARLAGRLGFVGRIEYRHVYSQTGGAQYGRGTTAEDDLLTVYAESFERDADPEDFSLTAIIAHERGHQILARHPEIAPRLEEVSLAAEEVLASLLGSMVCSEAWDRDVLVAKATAELLQAGNAPEDAVRLVQNLSDLLQEYL